MKPITNRKKLLSLLISQALVVPAQAAVFDIHCGDVTQLINAINTANSNGEVNEINLNADNQANCVYPLTVADNTTDGANGLPSITSTITINGHQSAIRRQGSDPFRIVHVASTGILTLKQLSVENGLATANVLQGIGGGILNHGGLTLEGSTVSGNTATDNGGGIFNYLSSTATLTNSTVSGNIASSNGGGIYNSNSTATLTNSTVSDNTASYGAGIYNNGNSIALTNSTVSENIASWSGGGIFNSFSRATFISSTVSGNTASSGGGIFNYYSIATLINTILAGNFVTISNPNCQNDEGVVFADHHNLFDGDGTACNAGATDLILLDKSIDDVLKPLANNGGPTQTMALVDNSLAIDAADDTACPATDQRDVSRPQGAKCDIGAFEYQPPDLIELGDFQAIATAQGIYLKWLTTSASDNAGFRLWRANLDQYGGYTNITALDNPQAQTLTATPLEAVTDWSHLIAAGGSAECYSYLDASAAPAGTTYFYLLEDVNMGGYRTFHWGNIVSATVGQNSSDNPQCEDE